MASIAAAWRHYISGWLALGLGLTVPASAAGLDEALTQGKFALHTRLRWEQAEQTGLHPSDALTLRGRLGFTSAPVSGVQGMIELEHIAALNDENDYNAGGTNPGGAGRTVIADPPGTQLNQAWLAYTRSGFTSKAGRQRIVLDNARFVGDSGWRQNAQTFDAATLNVSPGKNYTAFYGYVWRVNRVFGNRAPQRDFTARSHLLQMQWHGWKAGTVTAYALRLDLRNSAANSSETVGASLAGGAPVTDAFKLTYRLEAARQSDAANNPRRYTAPYWRAELGGVSGPGSFSAGWEQLGSDGGRQGFATPLATLHAFNGWADAFGTTPARGLRDTYATVGAALPGGWPLQVAYHDYQADHGAGHYGHEWNAQLAHKFGPRWSVLVKAARFSGSSAQASLRRLWAQTEYTF